MLVCFNVLYSKWLTLFPSPVQSAGNLLGSDSVSASTDQFLITLISLSISTSLLTSSGLRPVLPFSFQISFTPCLLVLLSFVLCGWAGFREFNSCTFVCSLSMFDFFVSRNKHDFLLQSGARLFTDPCESLVATAFCLLKPRSDSTGRTDLHSDINLH